MTRERKGKPKSRKGWLRSVERSGDWLSGRDENVGMVESAAEPGGSGLMVYKRIISKCPQ